MKYFYLLFPILLIKFNSCPSEIEKLIKIRENSGLAASPYTNGLVWTLNDSGNSPVLFALTLEGKLFPNSAYATEIKGITNIDWEDMSYTEEGLMLIADIGNNKKNRKIIQVYQINEPNYRLESYDGEIIRYNLQYPNNKFYNAEALFTIQNRAYIFTKVRDQKSHLFSFELNCSLKEQVMHLEAMIPLKGRITGADYNQDYGLLILTYKGIYFTNPVFPFEFIKYKFLPISFGQMEGITWTNNGNFIISNEAGGIKSFNVSNFFNLNTQM